MSVRFKNFVVENNKVRPISIQVEILRGMPDFEIIGLSDLSIREAKERSRAAIKNNGYKFPVHRKIINLTPANLKKTGTHFDICVILGLLIKSGQVIYSPKPDTIFLGEVDLDGNLQRVSNILKILDAAKEANIKQAFIPTENLREAYLVEGIKIIPVSDIRNLIEKLNTYNQHVERKIVVRKRPVDFKSPTFDDILNQEFAKKALTIAVAGFHSILLIGPPGGGKSMLAESCKNLMPWLTSQQAKEYLKIFDKELSNEQLPMQAPFSIVHGDISKAGLIINKRHELGTLPATNNGALVINELHELNKSSLEALKEPLETKEIRVDNSNIYPCNTIIIATMNPCKCGYYGDPGRVCYCTDYNLKLFKQKISGPLLDRFDIAVKLMSEPVSERSEVNKDHKETRAAIRLVNKARHKQVQINSMLDINTLMKGAGLDKKARNLIRVVERKYKPSTRRFAKILRVARTVADIKDEERITEENLAESINLQKFFLTNEWTNE